MSPRQPGRTETCGLKQARIRLAQARAFLEVAKLVGTENDELATPRVAASLAVLAGIALWTQLAVPLWAAGHADKITVKRLPC
jgi:hypothetical protein